MRKRSYLVVTASIGSGHIKAAEAICNVLKGRYPEDDIRCVDFMARETSWLNWMMKEIYLKMLAFVPNLYEFIYKFSGGHTGGTAVQQLLSRLMRRNMAKLVRRYAPDVVVCTHPFPEGAASCLKKQADTFMLATVMTDYSIHQMWLYPGVDLYFVATEQMKADLLAAGFAAAKVQVTGIPIAGRILEADEPAQILARLGLKAEVPVLLLMGGGLGLGGLDLTLQALEKVEKPLQLLVVAGKNKALLEKTKRFGKTSHHTIRVWGYTTEVPDFMAVASLLISKPGALTISEAFAMELPMLLHEPIPGPETENAIYVAEHGAGIWVRPDDDLAAMVEAVLQQPERMAAMRQAARSCRCPHAAEAVVEILEHGTENLEHKQLKM